MKTPFLSNFCFILYILSLQEPDNGISYPNPLRKLEWGKKYFQMDIKFHRYILKDYVNLLLSLPTAP